MGFWSLVSGGWRQCLCWSFHPRDLPVSFLLCQNLIFSVFFFKKKDIFEELDAIMPQVLCSQFFQVLLQTPSLKICQASNSLPLVVKLMSYFWPVKENRKTISFSFKDCSLSCGLSYMSRIMLLSRLELDINCVFFVFGKWVRTICARRLLVKLT